MPDSGYLHRKENLQDTESPAKALANLDGQSHDEAAALAVETKQTAADLAKVTEGKVAKLALETRRTAADLARDAEKKVAALAEAAAVLADALAIETENKAAALRVQTALVATEVSGRTTRRFNRFRRQSLAAYLVLTLAIGYAIEVEHQHSNHNRAQAAANTRLVLQEACAKGNDLRVVLRGLIVAGIPQTEKYVKEGTLTAAQGARSIKLTYQERDKIIILDCTHLYAPIN